LLTREPVEHEAQIRQIVRYDELRWRIEEFHKAWKRSVGVERQRLQSMENLERMWVITALVAIRLLPLRESLRDTAEPEIATTCTTALTTEPWQVLWLTDQASRLPQAPPSLRWACRAIAKLGGFTDTQRTGRPGWQTLWHGWARLQERIEGVRLAKK
jgi:hypothetical protein